MKIEVLYFDGCPSHAALVPRLQEMLESEGVKYQIELRAVETPEDAERERFLGSPTLRIDGSDVDPDAGERRDFGLKCRLYRVGGGYSPLPADEWIRAALVSSR